MKKTDMDSVKELARALLWIDPELTKFSPMVIRHPFTGVGIVGVVEDGKVQMLDITKDEASLNTWRKAMAKQIGQAEKAYEIYMMVNKPYALTFLKFAEPHLSKEDFSAILSSAWTMAEAPNQDINVSRRSLVAMFKKADPAVLMDEEEYELFKELDDTVTVYRGVTSYNAKNIKALSWTLDRDTAEYFAHRFGEDGTVYEAQIDKKHIYALFTGRNESEVIVDPKHLTDITEVMEMQQGYSMSMQ